MDNDYSDYCNMCDEELYADGTCPHCDYDFDEDYDDSMDGDFDSAMRDAGFGTDEDYGYYGYGDDW